MAWEKVRHMRRGQVASNAIRITKTKAGAIALVIPKFMATGPRCDLLADRAAKQIAFRIGDTGVAKVSVREKGHDAFVAIPNNITPILAAAPAGTHEVAVFPGVGEAAGYLVIDAHQFAPKKVADLFAKAVGDD